MLKPVQVNIDEIYLPLDRRKELDPQKVEQVVEQLMNDEDLPPIQVRLDTKKKRYVLVKGVHRLEARKVVGDETVAVYLVGARLH
ncbi:ParB N-terminal domain-containing protein [Magnetospira sp. QH-2]|uniref:ParB N-terminal domain-containing protein n=1 Tax=Magnetospira sp. (strain QH-2) TaxID=1288970 RepID=UPI0003E81B85|nr:ParB N-terminal domain-containing protein [Magnetospira sp. QH-2]CCQ73938.1 Conserved protein of unknown function [Magnetospira sp. QH-2]